ncbi:S-methyl-5-thioribose-1-phosphate isomerase [Tautonia plasticadhaerens]|uniref:Methylthioribose-1-phosphate isomerase n=1 Tax=Tautonia plasticadhaerens TaxID=2527974 RepID=A0A518H8W2_9BACT|nr:S-methyl-5-thioribose-1-phosphate isomerase [Tautonia plasticadhaerens]QDV37285.1 Methylthioribose-1-phosphate isomerase [Tautonia plasticadhaerens]
MTHHPTGPAPAVGPSIETVGWVGSARDGAVRLIDQTLLPVEFSRIDCRDVETVWEAIKMLRVRGAPAIGIAAAYGAVLGARGQGLGSVDAVVSSLRAAAAHLRTSRPTAVNLFWALDRMQRTAEAEATTAPGPEVLLDHLLDEARAIEQEDRAMCRAIGRFGAELLEPGHGILTHCNAGGLATSDYGTALAVIFSAVEQGKAVHVYADETRPLLQGARLTAWELQRRGIPVTLICDNMAPQVMKEGKIQAVVVGADRIAANGDTANKIGTYGVALAAKAHDIPFYVAAPSSTFDLSLPDGSSIPIEQRDPREITHGFGRQTAPEGVEVYNPAFDVTPSRMITAIITERGVIRPVTADAVADLIGT